MESSDQSDQVWLFQYQLSRYDLLAEVDSGERLDWWRASRHRRRMRVGERIYFLRAAGTGDTLDASVVAQGSIISEVRPQDRADGYPWIVKVRYEARMERLLTRDEMRKDSVIGTYGRPDGYGPLTIGKQGTQFLLPSEVAARVAQLVEHRLVPLSRPVPVPSTLPMNVEPLGIAYKPGNEEFSAVVISMIQIDGTHLKRANEVHSTLQNWLAKYLTMKGFVPVSPGDEEPDYDIAWRTGKSVFLAEVKSITKDNEETQLRLGLSQVLMYRHRLAARHEEVHAVLLVEERPTFDRWLSLCQELGVILVWRDHMDELDLALRG